ncbi:dermatopontin [Biomphalaria glabrata]|nr:dermatopontin-like dermatopontin-like Cell adhesion/Resistant factor [Biomphalaria glabrata]KAI8750480.1 dermatopontin [Biomphalaria glabrata]
MLSAVVNLIVLVLLVAVSECVGSFPWINEYEGPMDFKCPVNQTFMYLSSLHENRYEDRIWEIYCRSTDLGDLCVQSGYVNEFDATIDYTCPGNKILTGISSYHDNSKEDRRFKFTCCRGTKYLLRDCRSTDFVNDWDNKLTLFVPEGQAIRSVYAINDEGRRDRRFKFVLCSL